jgi:hypothetical protein
MAGRGCITDREARHLVGAVAAGVAWIKPRQRIAMTIGLVAFGAWLLLWILMFTVFGFKFGT